MTPNRGPIGLLLSLFLYSCFCQAAEQDYGHPVDFRLAENAGLLKLPPERLLKARIALRRATEAMDIITPRSGASLGPLVSGWKRLDPACLPGALAYLYEKSRQEALHADRAFGYEWSTLEAVLLLTEMTAIDADRAARLGEQWPQPPAAFGPNAEASYHRFWDRIASGRVGQVARTNPDHAEAIVSRIDTPLTYSARGKIMASLFREGRIDQAGTLAREVISDYRKGNPDQQLFLDFASFTALLSRFQTIFLSRRGRWRSGRTRRRKAGVLFPERTEGRSASPGRNRFCSVNSPTIAGAPRCSSRWPRASLTFTPGWRRSADSKH